MKFEERHSFEQPVETVLKMYTDRAFFERKYQATGALEMEELEHEKSADRFRVKWRLVMKSDAPLPEVLKKILGDTVKAVQQDTWDIATRSGRIDVEIKGAPVKVSAQMKLIDEKGKAVNVQSWNVSCGIPLVGGKVEAAIAEDIKAKSKKDLAASRKIIADY